MKKIIGYFIIFIVLFGGTLCYTFLENGISWHSFGIWCLACLLTGAIVSVIGFAVNLIYKK